MNDLASLIKSFDVSILFSIIQSLATAISLYLSPFLLIVAIYVRVMETQLDSLVTGNKYGAAIRDIIVWTFVLGSYFAIGNLIFEFFNPIYRWIDNWGSVSSTMSTFSDLVDKAKSANSETGLTLEGVATSVVASPYVIVTSFMYYITLVVIAFLAVFLKVANVLIFGVAFVWGLVAIPISISTTFKILRGWGLLLAFALVWPIVQGFIMSLFSALFINAATTLTTTPDTNGVMLVANLMLLATVAHLLLAAVMIAAPFITNALVSNATAAAGIVMPFVGAAIAAGAGAAAATKGGGSMFNSIQNRLGGASSKASLTTPSARGSGPKPAAASAPVSAASNPVASSGVDVAGDAGGAAAVPPPSGAKARQQRRGSIIRQGLKKRNTTT